MQLLKALLTLSILPAVLARSTLQHRHAAIEVEDDFNQLEARQGSTTRAPKCTKRGAHIILTSGAGSPDKGGIGLLNTTLAAIKAVVPYSNAHSTWYDKNNPSGAIAAATGVTNLTSHIEWYTAGCPNTPLILIGYSLGGIATMNTICGKSTTSSTTAPISPNYATNVAAVILYGEETRTNVAPTPYDYGTCTGQGIIPRQNPSACGPFIPLIRSWCDVNDPNCCVGGPNSNISNHFLYPSKYDADAAAYAKQMFRAWKTEHKTPTAL